MAIIGIYGPSGAGKSLSLANLDPKETYWIAPTKAPYSRKGSYTPGENCLILGEKDTIYWNQFANLIKKIAEKGVKNIVIDDFSHVLSNFVSKTANQNGYGKWNDLAVAMLNMISNNGFSGNLIVVGHTDLQTDPLTGASVLDWLMLGKLMRDKFYIPSYLDSVLYASTMEGDNAVHRVLYSNKDATIAKSRYPIVPDVFPNDFNFYLQRYTKYEELTSKNVPQEDIIKELSKIKPEPVWEANALTQESYFEV